MQEFVFGSGVIVGTLSKNDFYLGKTKINDVFFYEILAEEQIIGEMGGLDGIVGLGLSGVNPTPGFFDYLAQQKGIAEIFSFYLNREEETKKSKVIFGGIQTDLMKSKPKYYNVNDDYYWAIDMEAIIIGDKDTGICTKKNKCKAIIDTGTSLIAGSTWNIIQIASKFKNLPLFINFV